MQATISFFDKIKEEVNERKYEKILEKISSLLKKYTELEDEKFKLNKQCHNTSLYLQGVLRVLKERINEIDAILKEESDTWFREADKSMNELSLMLSIDFPEDILRLVNKLEPGTSEFENEIFSITNGPFPTKEQILFVAFLRASFDNINVKKLSKIIEFSVCYDSINTIFSIPTLFDEISTKLDKDKSK